MSIGSAHFMMQIQRSMIWSVVGTAFPVLAAIIAIPSLIAAMGDARFGILSLAWVLVGYFGFFDLGIGRALTHLVAARVAEDRAGELPSILRVGILLMAALGLVGGLVVAMLSPWIVNDMLSIPGQMRHEALIALYILAASIPIVILTSGFRGILEGMHRFDLVNIVKAPLGALTYLGPLIALPFTNELPGIVGILVVGRVLSLIAYALICSRVLPIYKDETRYAHTQIFELIAFGGWLTLSNIAGPLLLYLGRVLLAVLVSAEAVAHFATPYEVVIALLLLPGIYVSVLFPNFAQRFLDKREDVRGLYRKWQFYTLISMLPLCVITFVSSKLGLSAWISPEFAENSYRVAQILALGVFINSFGYISQCLIQAYGRPDLTAKLHVVELVAYVPYTWWLISTSGIEGAAVAWSIRVTISTAALVTIASLCLNGTINSRTRK